MSSTRSAADYADFLLPLLSPVTRLVDVGCGSGELTLELAALVGHVTGVDAEQDEIVAARQRAAVEGIANAQFVLGDAYALPVADGGADAVIGHSVLEALDAPAFAVSEMVRVVRSGGVVGVASVEYGGLLLAGPGAPLIRRFYDIREQLWLVDGADPYLGRRLRGLLSDAGLEAVVGQTKYFCYGTADSVREFGLGRAADCSDDWYVDSALRQGLATVEDLAAMRHAWTEWASSTDSYAGFAWCRAWGTKP